MYGEQLRSTVPLISRSDKEFHDLPIDQIHVRLRSMAAPLPFAVYCGAKWCVPKSCFVDSAAYALQDSDPRRRRRTIPVDPAAHLEPAKKVLALLLIRTS